MGVTITSFELENVKKIKAVSMRPSPVGLTVIGGNNSQGKTSVLDAIAWALGGDRYKPSEATRHESMVPPHLKVTLSNGLVVERSGKNSALKVTDPNGKKSGQQLLNEFVEELALNLPKFLTASSKEKANTLLRIIGLEDQLHKIETDISRLYNQRWALGQQAEQKKALAAEMPYYLDAPDDLVSISELIQRQQAILAKNGENQRKRQNLERLLSQEAANQIAINNLRAQLAELETRTDALRADIFVAQKSAADLQDESTAEIEADIANIETINAKVRSNAEHDRAEQEAKLLSDQYDDLTMQIERLRTTRTDLLAGADMPIPGLSVEDGEVTFNGCKWDCMSSAEQLICATAIVQRLNPKCGFVLLDKLEQLDGKQLADFGMWLKEHGLQAIATRVSTGGECSIIIEDGEIAPTIAPQKTWQEGQKW